MECIQVIFVHDNRFDGMYTANKATIHIHGEATAIHSNGGFGISALTSGKVLIHLPSHHNTIYNNGIEDRNSNRFLCSGNI